MLHTHIVMKHVKEPSCKEKCRKSATSDSTVSDASASSNSTNVDKVQPKKQQDKKPSGFQSRGKPCDVADSEGCDRDSSDDRPRIIRGGTGYKRIYEESEDDEAASKSDDKNVDTKDSKSESSSSESDDSTCDRRCSSDSSIPTGRGRYCKPYW